MAFYHVNSCSCPVGCCDCGTDYKEEAFIKLVRNHAEEATFKCKAPYLLDRRRTIIRPYLYGSESDKHGQYKTSILETPHIETAVTLIVMLNEEFKRHPEYSVKRLKRGISPILSAFSNKDEDKINTMLYDYFSYTVTMSDWL